jgi:hypothetical protein
MQFSPMAENKEPLDGISRDVTSLIFRRTRGLREYAYLFFFEGDV